MPKTKTSAKPLAAFSVAAKKRCSLNDPDLNNDIVEETRIGPASNLQDEDHFPCADLSNADAGEISTSAFHLQERKQKLIEMQPIAGRTEPPHPVKYHYADTFWCIYITSVVSACIAELATYPLDLTKTRLQIQGEALTANIHNAKKVHSHRGMVATALGIVREEGSLKLWQGVTPALYRHVVYSGCRIVVYDNLRKKLGSTGQVGIPLYQSAICGITAGGLAQWLASPADLVKVQVQMEGKRRLMGLPPRVHSAAHAFMEIVRRGGIKGLWKGSIPNVQRAALVNLGDLTTYDHIKRTIITKTGLPDSHTVHILSSICAGLVAAGMGTPADVVKTRVMNQPTDNNGRGLLYRGAIDCLRQTVSKEGFFALYKGFLPVWIRMAPWSLTFWMSFEEIRRMLGTNSY